MAINHQPLILIPYQILNIPRTHSFLITSCVPTDPTCRPAEQVKLSTPQSPDFHPSNVHVVGKRKINMEFLCYQRSPGGLQFEVAFHFVLFTTAVGEFSSSCFKHTGAAGNKRQFVAISDSSEFFFSLLTI